MKKSPIVYFQEGQRRPKSIAIVLIVLIKSQFFMVIVFVLKHTIIIIKEMNSLAEAISTLFL